MKNKSYPFVQQNASLFSTPPQPHLSREYRTVYYAVQGGSNNVLSFESVDEILWCILQYFPVQQAQQN